MDLKKTQKMFHNCHKLDRKFVPYRIDFLGEHGHFKHHAAPNHALPDRGITYVQAYNAASKYSAAIDSGTVPAAVMCDFYRQHGSPKMVNAGNVTAQYIRDILSHFNWTFRESCVLRIEDVTTIDPLRCAQSSVTEFIAANHTFSDTIINASAYWLLRHNAIRRFTNWQRFTSTHASRKTLDFFVVVC